LSCPRKHEQRVAEGIAPMAAKKRALLIAGIVVFAILVVLIVTPFFINADRFRPQITQALSEKMGRQVEIGHLSVSLLRGSLVAEQIKIADDPAYSREPFVTAKSLAVGVELLPLVFSRTVKVHSLTFDEPHVQLLRSARGDWNFASLGGTGKERRASPAASPEVSGFSVGQLSIRDGTIAFGRAGRPAGLAYTNVNATAENISQTAAFPLRFDAGTPGGGKLSLRAQVGPLGSGAFSQMPFQGQFKADGVPAGDVENLLAVLGYALPGGSSLRGGSIKADLALHGPFDRVVASGPVDLRDVTLSGFSLASKLAGAVGAAGRATGNDTLIQLASSKLRYSPEGVRAEDLNIVIPAIGSLTGAGTVSANNRLNFRMLAKIAAGSPLAALTSLPIFGQGGGGQAGGLPFRIEGTTSDPVVVPDFAGLAKNPLNRLAVPQKGGLQQMIPGLFKNAKPPL
jgi:AsmA protein